MPTAAIIPATPAPLIPTMLATVSAAGDHSG